MLWQYLEDTLLYIEKHKNKQQDLIEMGGAGGNGDNK